MIRIRFILLAIILTFSGVTALLLPGTAKAAAAKKPCTHQFYGQGARGDCVGYIQTMLNLTNNAKLSTDKKFGPLTKAAVKGWQTDKKIVVDGIVGPETWGTLCAVNDAGSEAYKAHKILAGCHNQLSCSRA